MGIYLTRQGGPFVGVVKSEKLDLLIDAAMRISPEGPPMRGIKRVAVRNISPDVYTKWFRELFGRTVPTPISN